MLKPDEPSDDRGRSDWLELNDKESNEMIKGTWTPLSAEFGGKPFPHQVLTTMKLVLTERDYTALVGSVKDVGTYSLHVLERPAGMDIVGTEGPNKGKTILAIYHLQGDILTICYNLEGNKRPQDFNTRHDTQEFLVTYKRVKT